MQPIRRAALRAACSSSRAFAVPRQQVASIAVHIGKAANLRPAAMLPITRYFSQTVRVAQEDSNVVEQPLEYSQESSQAQSQRNDPEAAGRTIFISNITFDATEQHLREAFSKYGEIESIHIGRDGRGLSRGFSFVTFTDKTVAQKAINEAHQSFWHGRRINVALRKQTTERPTPKEASNNEPTNCLYIGNIPYETSDTDLNSLFRDLENVIDVRVAVDRHTGWPRGFAHADFTDVESAQNAYEKVKEMSMNGRSLRVDYSQGRKPRGAGAGREE